MRKQYDDDLIVIVTAFSNIIIILFVDLFDDACAKSSARQITTLTFEHILIFFLTIIDYKYNFNLIISFYIKFLSCS